MRTPIELRTDAEDCLRLADQTKAPRHKSLFLLMAQAWTMLAQQAEGIESPTDAAGSGEPSTQTTH